MSVVLITGGAGYIGSHATSVLTAAGHQCVLVDDLSNSCVDRVRWALSEAKGNARLIEADITDIASIHEIIRSTSPDAVVHLAALKNSRASLDAPAEYDRVNTQGTAAVVSAMDHANCHKLVFASSAAVYAKSPNALEVTRSPTVPTTPYGRTKLESENNLGQLVSADHRWNIAVLRFFNAAGAHPTSRPTSHEPPVSHDLLSTLCKSTESSGPPVEIMGTHHPTDDGTAIRDYVHVMDAAGAISKVVAQLDLASGCHIWNIGTGKGTSVFQLIALFNSIAGRTVDTVQGRPRSGDPPQLCR